LSDKCRSCLLFHTALKGSSTEHKKKKKKKKVEEEEVPKKLDHQKTSLFPAEKRLFTSAIKSWMGSSASCHDQDHRMKIEEVRGLVEVEE
jgi:hypothetical protein